jgi:hypothetical protein
VYSRGRLSVSLSRDNLSRPVLCRRHDGGDTCTEIHVGGDSSLCALFAIADQTAILPVE